MTEKPIVSVAPTLEPPKTASDLPKLDLVFKKLSQGYHICSADTELYWLLHEHWDAYSKLFERLGFHPKQHTRGFYYFDGDTITGTAESMAVFMFVLIEDMSGKGIPLEEGLTRRIWKIEQLPHLATVRYREMMQAVNVTESNLRQVITWLQKYGFAAEGGEDAFTFREPIYRFVDLCLIVLRASMKPSAPDGDV